MFEARASLASARAVLKQKSLESSGFFEDFRRRSVSGRQGCASVRSTISAVFVRHLTLGARGELAARTVRVWESRVPVRWAFTVGDFGRKLTTPPHPPLPKGGSKKRVYES